MTDDKGCTNVSMSSRREMKWPALTFHKSPLVSPGVASIHLTRTTAMSKEAESAVSVSCGKHSGRQRPLHGVEEARQLLSEIGISPQHRSSALRSTCGPGGGGVWGAGAGGEVEVEVEAAPHLLLASCSGSRGVG